LPYVALRYIGAAMSQSNKPTRLAPEAGRTRLGDYSADSRMLLLVGMALIVGAAGAFSAWVLLKLIALITNLAWFGRFSMSSVHIADAHAGLMTVIIPAAGGLIIGLMARYGSEKIRGHGIPEAIEAILFGQSRMSPKVALLKPISSAISIGSGGPFGAEGPIIMTGGAFGSLFAQFFSLSAAERKTLLVAGAAAGMTAIFATPVAAVLLAVELLLFEWKPRSFIPVATAAMVSSLLRPFLFGAGPLFAFTSGPLPDWALLAAVGVGLATGLLSALLTNALYWLEDLFEHLPIHWMWWPALGGLVVGIGGLFEPRALGVGYDVIHDLLTQHMLLSAVLLILVVKAIVWLVALSSGTSGGVLAPLLILGGGLGWLLGIFLPGTPGIWALVGMAAMLGGTMRSPLTGAIFAVELTANFGLLPHLFAGSVAAYMVTVLLLPRSILTEKIARRGQHISREYAIDPLTLTRVGEVMIRKVDVLRSDIQVTQAVAAIEGGKHRTYPVVDGAGRPIGLVSRGDALRWRVEGGHPNETLGEHISDASVALVHADEIISNAVEIMLATDQGRLPVVDRDTGALIGLLTRRDILAVRGKDTDAELNRDTYLGRSLRTAAESLIGTGAPD
jgi:H+/Cl- antiporter ClcA/CBS domain-containing protein